MPPATAYAPGDRFNFAQYLAEQNAHRLARTAFIDDTGPLSYGALFDGVRAMAGGLQALGLRREERVLLLMNDCNHWPISFLACLYAGIVPVAVNTLMTADDYAYMLQHCRAQAALVSAGLLPVLADALARSQASGGHELSRIIVSNPQAIELADSTDVTGAAHNGKPTVIPIESLLAAPPSGQAAATGANEPAFWLYSSGSTGRPKGAVHTQSNLYWTTELYGKPVLGITEDDICFSAAKLFFAYGLGNSLSFPLAVGATVILMAERPTPAAVFKRWTQLRPTVFFGAPTGYAGMLAAADAPRREQVALRLCSSAGEALPAELGKRFTDRYGCEIIDGIGSTEMLHIFLSNRPGKVRYGTTGQPVNGYLLELRGEDGRLVADGEVGDLFINGPSAALMYWGNRDKSREAFQGAWTKSGDKYVRDADGFFTYAGRSDDMLKVSGIYVSPFEVEATLMQHDAVLEAAVIGCEDSDGLTRAKAFVVLKAGQKTTDSELKAFVKDRLAPYKYPRLIEFVNELPKTATGKIQRFKLRDAQRGQ